MTTHTPPCRRHPATVAALALAVLAAPAAAQYPASYMWHNTTLRGDNYQSHNQKIVWTANGLFRSGDQQTGWPSYHPNDNVVVQRSTDGGATWSRIFDTGVHRDNLKPVTVEADEDANIYLIYPNSGGTRFVKFSASNNYASAVVNRLHNQATSASKFASFYDQGRQRLLHATQSGYLFTFDRGGNFVRGQQLFQGGSTGSRPSYPHLFVDESGIIHYALTIADAGDDIPYETIRYLKSLDGGLTWKAMNGAAISIPTTSNPNGPSTMINQPGEENYQTWLAAMHVKNGKAHFAYRVRNPANPAGAGTPPVITEHTHYMRFSVATGVREIDSSPNGQGWSGGTLAVTDYSASFASDPDDPDGPLYAVGKGGSRLSALVSYNNGTTWQDYARSGSFSELHNPDIHRWLTPDGKIVGCAATSSPAWATVNFFTLPANQPPQVDAGPDQATATRRADLDGTVTDDGTSPVTTTWSKVSGLGLVGFDDATAAATTAIFSQAGTFAQVVGTREASAVTERLRSVTASGFEVKLDEEEANDGAHLAETVHWIAIQRTGGNSDGQLFQAANTARIVTHTPTAISFTQPFATAPVFLANSQTYAGEPCALRLTALTSSSATLFLEEETSADPETDHSAESVGWLAMDAGLLTAAPTDFAAWTAANAPGETVDMDHDHDGVPNGIEYFMGESGNGFTALPVPDATGTISWPMGSDYPGAYGTHYVVETSMNLAAWDPVPAGEVTIGATVDYTIPNNGPVRFTRLKVTGP